IVLGPFPPLAIKGRFIALVAIDVVIRIIAAQGPGDALVVLIPLPGIRTGTAHLGHKLVLAITGPVVLPVGLQLCPAQVIIFGPSICVAGWPILIRAIPPGRPPPSPYLLVTIVSLAHRPS